MRGSSKRRRWAGAGALAALTLAIGGLLSPGSATQPECRDRGVEPALAGGLPGLADTASERAANWKWAATTLVRFAGLRPMCDPARREALRLAARYYGYAGEYERAAEVAFEAAEQGRRTGHLTHAADAFIEAATFALEAGNPVCAARAARQAALLAESPLLAPAQRIAIRGRAASLLGGAG